MAGLLGIPFPNGLIPQAPFHTNSLCVTRQVRVPVYGKKRRNDDNNGDDDDEQSSIDEKDQEYKIERVVDHVVEQRVSNFIQGALCLIVMTGPLLIVIGLIPQGVLAGLFFTMGTQALASNGIVLKLVYLFSDRKLTVGHPLRKLERQWAIWFFVACELLFFAVAFAITQTVAAIGFPVILILPIPFRTWVLPKVLKRKELDALDAPTASPFTMESVGGVHGLEEDEDVDEGGNKNEDIGRKPQPTPSGEDKTRRESEKPERATTTGRDDASSSQDENNLRFSGGAVPRPQHTEGQGGTMQSGASSSIAALSDPWKL